MAEPESLQEITRVMAAVSAESTRRLHAITWDFARTSGDLFAATPQVAGDWRKHPLADFADDPQTCAACRFTGGMCPYHLGVWNGWAKLACAMQVLATDPDVLTSEGWARAKAMIASLRVRAGAA